MLCFLNSEIVRFLEICFKHIFNEGLIIKKVIDENPVRKKASGSITVNTERLCVKREANAEQPM